jgi:hypothetical protein
MSVKDFVMKRKIGAFELLTGLIFFELFLGSRLMLLVTFILAVVFFFLKMHFGGEFSLAQLSELFDGKTEKKDQEKPTT